VAENANEVLPVIRRAMQATRAEPRAAPETIAKF
jgi:hypothetical protein